MRDGASTLRVLQVNTRDLGGGAEKIAHDLFQAMRVKGHASWFAVGRKVGCDPDVFQIPPPDQFFSAYTRALIQVRDWLREQNQRVPGLWRLSSLIDWLARPRKKWVRRWGVEYFHYPGSRQILNLPPERPDLIHAHNLHGGYFDLRYLAELSQQTPLALTLHDEWALTGHCAYTLGCPRWECGCG